MRRRTFATGAFATSALATSMLSVGLAARGSPALISSACAATGLDGPIRVIVGYSPGGTSDVTARVVAQAISAQLGAQVLVENRPGARGRIAIDMVARAKPDGRTLLIGPTDSLYQVALDQNRAVKAGDPLLPVTILSAQSPVLVAHPARGWKTVAEVIAAAKAAPQGLHYAAPSTGIGSYDIAAQAIFRPAAGKVTKVPYKGGSQAVQDLLADVVPLGLLGTAPVMPHAKSGKLTILAVASKDRDPLLPGVPGMKELGYAGVDISQWFALFAPPETPKEIVDCLAAVARAVLAEPTVVELLARSALSPVGGTPEDFNRHYENKGATWTEAVRALMREPH